MIPSWFLSLEYAWDKDSFELLDSLFEELDDSPLPAWSTLPAESSLLTLLDFACRENLSIKPAQVAFCRLKEYSWCDCRDSSKSLGRYKICTSLGSLNALFIKPKNQSGPRCFEPSSLPLCFQIYVYNIHKRLFSDCMHDHGEKSHSSDNVMANENIKISPNRFIDLLSQGKSRKLTINLPKKCCIQHAIWDGDHQIKSNLKLNPSFWIYNILNTFISSTTDE